MCVFALERKSSLRKGNRGERPKNTINFYYKFDCAFSNFSSKALEIVFLLSRNISFFDSMKCRRKISFDKFPRIFICFIALSLEEELLMLEKDEGEKEKQ